MFDLKVVAAVLITLLGIAAGMGQGVVQQQDLANLKDLPAFFSKLRDVNFDWSPDFFAQGNGKDKITISANFNRDQLQEFELTFSQPIKQLTASYTPSSGNIKINGMSISPKGSQGSLKLKNYRGSIKLGSKVSLDGKCSAAELNDVSFNSSEIKVSTTGFSPSQLQLAGTPPFTLDFEQVSGKLSTGSRNTSISLDKRDLDIVGFEGDLEVDSARSSYHLTGNASRVLSVDGGSKVTLKQPS